MGPEDDHNDVCCIDLIKAFDEPIFYVTTCTNTDWVWAFHMDGESNYEMVKHTIIDAIFECDDIIELMDYLDAVFEESFDDIVAWEEEMYDDCCCENCNHRGCLN
jgi:hypothetical protein